MEVDFDLSDVMFVATSNSLNIPPPLLDRMEVIRLSGYTEDEKVNIAQRYLPPKQIKNNGLKVGEIAVAEDAIRDIIRYYTREAGVRSLEREISKIARKVVKLLLLKKESGTVTVEAANLDKFLGVRKYDFGTAGKENRVGGDRPGVDRGGWRSADHRSRHHAGQGQHHPHRFAGRRDEGVGRGSPFGGAFARTPPGHRG